MAGGINAASKGTSILIVLEVLDKATKQLEQVSQKISGLNNATQGTSKSSKQAAGGLGGLVTAIGKAGLAIGAATLAFKAFSSVMSTSIDYLEEGAAVRQTAISFGFMTESVGETAALLTDLRATSRGTISDMQLMSYATTALAGAQGDFGKQMAANLPHLLAIAKAANKANPALGSVDYQFQSLIIGLKRLSPRLIDNTGLQIKLSAAYEALAQQLGKEREELTAEEQQMALLNATMEAGNRLMEQVGGTAASLTDEFGYAKAGSENLSNAIKSGLSQQFSWLGKAIGDATNAIADFLLIQERMENSVAADERAILAAAQSYEEYYQKTVDAAVARGMIGKADRNVLMFAYRLEKQFGELTMAKIKDLQASEDLTASERISLEYYVNNIESIEEYNKAIGLKTQWEYIGARATDVFVEKLNRVPEVEEDIVEALTEEEIAAEELRKEKELLAQATLRGEAAIYLYKKSLDAAAEAQARAKTGVGELIGSIDSGLSNTIANFYKDIEFFLAGGGELQKQFQAVKQAILDEKITPEEGQSYLQELFAATKSLDVELGESSMYEAAREVQKTLGVSYQEAYNWLMKLKKEGRTVDLGLPFAIATDSVDEYYQKLVDAAEQSEGLNIAPEGLPSKEEVEQAINDLNTKILGIKSAEDAEAILSDLRKQLDLGLISLPQYVEQVNALVEALAKLTNKNITVNVDFVGRVPKSPLSLGGVPMPPISMRAAGGAVFPGNIYRINEFSPEFFEPNVSGRIVPASEAIASAPAVQVYIQNPTISSEIDLEMLSYRVAQRINQKVKHG